MWKSRKSKFKLLFCTILTLFCIPLFVVFFRERINKNRKRQAEVVLCTATTGRYYDSMLSKAAKVPEDMLFAARMGHFNLLSPLSLNISQKYQMRMYTEDSLDNDNKRPTVRLHNPIQNVEYIDIFDKFEWLREYVDNPQNSIRRFYKNLKRYRKDAKDNSDTDLGLLRKTLAIFDTLKSVPDGTVVLWLDMDTYFIKKLSREVIQFLEAADVTYIPSFANPEKCKHEFPFVNDTMKNFCGICADTGILAYIASERTRRFLEEQIEWVLKGAIVFQNDCYKGKKEESYCNSGLHKKGSICSHTDSLNDVSVFGYSMLNNLRYVKQQFFSTGCLKYEDGKWVELAKFYKVTRTMLCGSEHEYIKTSTFNILEYIMHFRGTSTGLAKRRSLWDSGEPGPKISFVNSLKKRGASGQKIQSII